MEQEEIKTGFPKQPDETEITPEEAFTNKAAEITAETGLHKITESLPAIETTEKTNDTPQTAKPSLKNETINIISENLSVSEILEILTSGEKIPTELEKVILGDNAENINLKNYKNAKISPISIISQQLDKHITKHRDHREIAPGIIFLLKLNEKLLVNLRKALQDEKNAPKRLITKFFTYISPAHKTNRQLDIEELIRITTTNAEQLESVLKDKLIEDEIRALGTHSTIILRESQMDQKIEELTDLAAKIKASGGKIPKETINKLTTLAEEMKNIHSEAKHPEIIKEITIYQKLERLKNLTKYLRNNVKTINESIYDWPTSRDAKQSRALLHMLQRPFPLILSTIERLTILIEDQAQKEQSYLKKMAEETEKLKKEIEEIDKDKKVTLRSFKKNTGTSTSQKNTNIRIGHFIVREGEKLVNLLINNLDYIETKHTPLIENYADEKFKEFIETNSKSA